LKILQVINKFLPEQTAGTEVYVWALSKALLNIGHNVEIAIPNFNKAIDESYKYDGLTVHKFSENSIVDRALIMGFKKPDGLKNFELLLQQINPDVIHFHEISGSNGITIHHVAAAKSFGAKVFFTFHLAGYTCKTGTLIQNEKNICDGLIIYNKCAACYLHTKGSGFIQSMLLPVSNVLFKANINTTKWNSKLGTALGTLTVIDTLKNNFESIIANTNKVIVLTDWYRKILLSNNVQKEKIEFIPQGLPFPSALPKIEIQAKLPIRIIFIGRISALKGLHLLIEAILKISSDKVLLEIFGESDGSDYETSLKNITKNESNIFWKGLLPQADVIRTMQEFHLLCLCSTFSEMSPLVIQEAFAAGIPVLASNVYGNAEQINKNNAGWLFEYKNATDLGNKILTLINNPSLITVASKNINPVNSFESIATSYHDLYNNN
jgi:glycosyltransferase involved in cell wall biosynthesis